MQEYDWSQFKLRIPVKATAEQLYHLWMTQHGLESWFLRNAAFKKANGDHVERNALVEVGDTYQWLWYGYGDDTFEKGAILQANGKDKLQFSFGKAGNVAVSFKEEAGEMMVE